MDKVGNLSDVIRQTIPEHQTIQLSKCVYDRLDYADRVVAFATLFESEIAAKFFIAQALKTQKRYLDKLARS